MKVYADCLDRLAQTTGGMAARLAANGFEIPFHAMLVALWLLLLLAPWVVRAYSRRVRRYMGFREVSAPPAAWWARRGAASAQPQPADTGAAAHDGPACTLAAAVAGRQRRLRWATVAAASVLVALPTVWHALVGPAALEVQGGLLLFLLVTVLVPAWVNLTPEGRKYWLLPAGLVLLLPALWSAQVAGLAALLPGVLNVGFFFATVAHRTWRVLFLPLFILLLGLLAGATAALFALAPMQCVPRAVALDAAQNTAVLLILAGSVAALVAGVAASVWLLNGLNALLRRAWVSDLSLVAAAGSAYLLFWVLTGHFFTHLPLAHKLSLAALTLAGMVTAYALLLWCMPCPSPGASRSLLMLRVFSKDRRAERLLDALQSRWRLAGPVLQIGGPDLAHLNLKLSAFIHVASGRTHELFQPGVVPAEVLARSLQRLPDREGRFQVNEVFCFDTAWRGVVEQLLHLADGVLLDLRGFNAERSGTTFEVERLAALGLLPRVVAVGDAHTDWAWFEARVAAASVGPVAPLALRVDASAPGALQQCMDCLMAVSDRR